MARKNECIAMLLAGGQGSRLGILTHKIAKPAVPFGGKYRIIDFPLSGPRPHGRRRPHPVPVSADPGHGLVQRHRKCHLPEHPLHRQIRPRVRRGPVRRPHLQDGLRRHARLPQAAGRCLHHRHARGRVERSLPFRSHDRQRGRHHLRVRGETGEPAFQQGLHGHLHLHLVQTPRIPHRRRERPRVLQRLRSQRHPRHA